MIRAVIKKLSYALFPRRCTLCGEVVELDKHLCENCESNKRVNGAICKRCGCSVDDCKCKINDKVKYECVAAPFYFENGASNAVYRFKFYGYTELAEAMANEMTETIKQRYCDVEFDYITYVPLTKKRMRKRGYNQSQLLADFIAKNINVPCSELLLKVRETSSQRESTAVQRRQNLRNAFKIVDNADIKGKTILLIDDVKTTGSTLNECTKILKQNGAGAVYACAFTITKKI
ncbi:MAG: ComF family protein [Eubacterium sp.]